METTTTRKNSHGANVRRWREWRNINQDVLAEQIGVSQATLSGYEKRDKLEPELIDKIAQALDIPTEAITEIGTESSINIYSGNWHDHSSGPSQIYNPIEKVTELYERLLKSEQEKVAMLHEILLEKK